MTTDLYLLIQSPPLIPNSYMRNMNNFGMQNLGLERSSHFFSYAANEIFSWHLNVFTMASQISLQVSNDVLTSFVFTLY